MIGGSSFPNWNGMAMERAAIDYVACFISMGRKSAEHGSLPAPPSNQPQRRRTEVASPLTASTERGKRSVRTPLVSRQSRPFLLALRPIRRGMPDAALPPVRDPEPTPRYPLRGRRVRGLPLFREAPPDRLAGARAGVPRADGRSQRSRLRRALRLRGRELRRQGQPLDRAEADRAG